MENVLYPLYDSTVTRPDPLLLSLSLPLPPGMLLLLQLYGPCSVVVQCIVFTPFMPCHPIHPIHPNLALPSFDSLKLLPIVSILLYCDVYDSRLDSIGNFCLPQHTTASKAKHLKAELRHHIIPLLKFVCSSVLYHPLVQAVILNE